VSKSLADHWRSYRALPSMQRELVTFALMLLLALTLLPVAIYSAGQIFLGEYVRDPAGAPTGGLGALWVDYLGGIFSGSVGHWLVLLGPWLLLMAARGLLALARRGRPTAGASPVPPPQPPKRDINQPLA
jgi:hypothetical protein